MGGVLDHVRAGRLKGLAISAAKRSLVVPDIPTIAEAGYDLQRETYYALLAPAATPEAVVALLEREARSALQAADLVKRFATMNVDIVASSAADARARLEADAKLWPKVIKDTEMRAD